jgi:dTMP kinase
VADHAAHLDVVVRPALAEGRVVISDRYSDSRYAYQAVTLEGHLPDPLVWIRGVHEGWTVRPDRTYLLVIPVDEALRRLTANAHREHFEQAEILERVQQHYLDFAAEDPGRFVILDAMKEKEEIVSFVAGDIRRHAGRSRSRPRRS